MAHNTLYAKWMPEVEGMVWIPNGSFEMGKYQVTQAQYEAVKGTKPSYFQAPVSPETSTANRPVEYVSWYGAIGSVSGV